MSGFVVTVLVVAGVVAGTTGLAMLFGVALGRGGDAAVRRRHEVRRWTPPFVQGPELQDWARRTAAATVERVTHEGSDRGTPGRLADALVAGAERAMVPDTWGVDLERSVPCPETGQGVIGVTPPEALRIAEYLRRQMSAAGLARLRREASDNVGWIRRISSVYGSDAPCALQGADCVCAAWAARPLYCRALHSVTRARWTDATDPWLDEAAEAHASLVRDGVIEGAVEGLVGAGLQAGVYELHSAVGRALDQPDAAARWAAGEEVFAGCTLLRFDGWHSEREPTRH